MCLSVPGRVMDFAREDDLLMGRVDFGGVARRICLEHVPEVQPGDYVLVHVGFALARLDEAEASKIFALLEGSEDLAELKESSE